MTEAQSRRVAILAWGSLVWDRGALPIDGEWAEGGPTLPIEFSRVSDDGRLTLVIDADAGVPVRTRFATSTRSDVDAAVRDLAAREGTAVGRIGYTDAVAAKHRSASERVAAVVRDWSARNGFDAVLWTDLPPTFKDKTGAAFSVDAACQYLRGLAGATADRAREYIQKAPPEVDTPLRRKMREVGWLA